jgi:hypothetical protein
MGGVLTGLLFSEFFGAHSNSFRQMYFKYKPGQKNWRLVRDFRKRGSGFYSRGKLVAKFENPNGGRDFIVSVNKRGDWFFECPKKFRKIFCWLSSVKHRCLYYMKEIGSGPTSYEPSVHRNFKYWQR